MSPFPVSACLPFTALSPYFLRGRAAERSPSPPGLPPAAAFPLCHGWVPDLPQPPHQCLEERLRRGRAGPASMPPGISGASLLPFHCFLAVWHETALGTCFLILHSLDSSRPSPLPSPTVQSVSWLGLRISGVGRLGPCWVFFIQ